MNNNDICLMILLFNRKGETITLTERNQVNDNIVKKKSSLVCKSIKSQRIEFLRSYTAYYKPQQ